MRVIIIIVETVKYSPSEITARGALFIGSLLLDSRVVAFEDGVY